MELLVQRRCIHGRGPGCAAAGLGVLDNKLSWMGAEFDFLGCSNRREYNHCQGIWRGKTCWTVVCVKEKHGADCFILARVLAQPSQSHCHYCECRFLLSHLVFRG